MAQIYIEGIGYIEIPDGAFQAAADPTPAPAPIPQAPPTPPPAQAAAPPSNFDAAAYLAQNPDIGQYAAANGLDPTQFAAQHYNTTGQYEVAAGTRQEYAPSYSPPPPPASGGGVSSQAAAAAAAQTAAGGGAPTAADIARAAALLAAQNQTPTPQQNPQFSQTSGAQAIDDFNAAAYLAQNPDIAAAAKAQGVDPNQFAAQHYATTGKNEIAAGTRQAGFDASTPKVAAGAVPTDASAADMAALEARKAAGTPGATATNPTSPTFDAQAYLDQNPDIAAAAKAQGADPLQFAAQHYATTGKNEIAAGTRSLSATDAAKPKEPVKVNPKANWADFFTKVPGVQDWAKNAMQAEWAPTGWGGGPIDSMEEAAAAYQWMYGDGGTGLGFAAKDPSKYLYDPEHPDLNTRGLLDAQGNIQTIDANALAHKDVQPFAANGKDVGKLPTTPPPGQPDWAAYTNAYPDLAAAAKAAGVDAATYGKQHYATNGQTEGRAVPGFAAGAQIPNTPGPATASPTWTNPSIADLKSGAATSQLYKAGTEITFDDGHTVKPGTDFYVAYTNSGDPTAIIGANEGQQIALLDPKTKEVLFYGVGPEAARQATEMATALSQDKGRKAAWQLAINTTGGTEDKDWQLAGYDKKDPKANVLGSIARIVLPIAGALLLPGIGAGLGLGLSGAAAAGVGAALGSGLASAINGDSLKQALIGAAISGAGAAFLPKIPGMDKIGGALNKVPGVSSVTGALSRAGTSIGGALSGGAGALSGSASGALVGGAGLDALVGSAAGDQLAQSVATELGGITVTAGMGAVASQALAAGLSAEVAAHLVRQSIGYVDPAVVTIGGKPTVVEAAGATAGAIGSGAANVDEIEVTKPQTNVDNLKPTEAIGAGLGAITATPSLTDRLTANVKNNPLGAAAAALTIAGALGAGGKNDGSQYKSTFTGGTKPGTRGSLDPTFSDSTLPASTFGGRTPTGFTADERYGFGPEASFFNRSGTGGSMFAAQNFGDSGFGDISPLSARQTGGTAVPAAAVSDLAALGFDASEGNFDTWIAAQPETIKAQARAIFKARGATPKFAAGGGVRGAGSGRDDKIDAMLSDGEYVMDAETVALLGDGSSKHGAKRLDEFRANVRKHKGAKLAKGGFSANAKRPEAYLKGAA